MMIKQLLIFALSASVALGAQAQSTQKLSAGKANDYGLVYNLPLTRINVTLEVERTQAKPGEFFRYSKKYLSIDPVTAPSQSWKLKSAMLTTEGVASPEESYLVQFKNGSTPFMIVDSNSFPVAVNDADATLPAPPEYPRAVEAGPSVLDLPIAAQSMTQEMIQSQSSAKRAELAANKIYELRQSRNDIISGQADQMPADGQAMKIALDNLEAQESALTAMFAGTKQISTEVVTLGWLVEMGEDERRRVLIARLSPVDGLVSPDDLSGEPVYLDITVRSRGELPVNEKGEPKRFPKGGMAYRIPGNVMAEVVYNDRTVARATLDVAQLGIVFGLDPSMFTDRKAPAYVRFDPASGAVVEIGTANSQQ